MTTLKKQNNLQETFLNHLRTTKAPVTIYLGNGIKLEGIITEFDTFALLFKRGKSCQLIYKHGISTIMPVKAIQEFHGEEDEEEQSEHYGVI